MTTKILVTGGCGFIGSNLIRQLISSWKNVEILSIDNYSTGTKENEIKNSDHVTYLNLSTWNILENEVCLSFQPKYVFHFGEYSRIVTSFDEPSKTFQSNILGTQQILEYCIKKKAKLIYSGSSAIFGNCMSDQNLNPYAWTKSKNIELIYNYKQWYGLEFALCYFYNVYGRNHIKEGKYATVIGIFEHQYENNLPLTIVSPGSQSRIFTYIDDVIEGVMMVALYGDGDDYFLYHNESYSMMEIKNLFGREYPYTLIKKRKGEREKSTIFTSRAITELNWNPKVSLRNYIHDYINDYIYNETNKNTA